MDLSHIIMELLRMTPALTVNGEANFEWRPAAKATTQLITHVTSKYSREAEKISASPPKAPSLSILVTLIKTLKASGDRKLFCSPPLFPSIMMTFYKFHFVTCNLQKLKTMIESCHFRPHGKFMHF